MEAKCEHTSALTGQTGQGRRRRAPHHFSVPHFALENYKMQGFMTHLSNIQTENARKECTFRIVTLCFQYLDINFQELIAYNFQKQIYLVSQAEILAPTAVYAQTHSQHMNRKDCSCYS